MTRLTKSIREEMVAALLRHKMKDAGDKLARENVALFKAVYESLYNDEMKAIVQRLKVYEDRSICKTDCFYVTANGFNLNVGLQMIGPNGALLRLDVADKYEVLNVHDNRRIGVHGELATRVQQFAIDCKAYGDEAARNIATAANAFAKFTTAKALAKGWPDVLPVVGHLIPEGVAATLPAVQVADLNRTFKLPPEEIAA